MPGLAGEDRVKGGGGHCRPSQARARAWLSASRGSRPGPTSIRRARTGSADRRQAQITLACAAFGSLRAAQQRLATLTGLCAVGRFRRNLPAGSEPWKYHLAPAGAALIAAERGQPAPPPRKVAARALALAASQRLGHLLGVNGFFTCLAAAARASGGTCVLAEWHSEQRCAAEYGGIVRPDGYGAWACAGHVT
ncbi:MAG TPA: replication-relaxation family protein [Streptosporangiaceae bacterium]|nr:replication-relaxation family protein [Streptosporangiaceae bacterium]